MGLEQAIAFLLFSAVAAGTPGPNNVILTATGANVGLLRGMPGVFGITLGMGLMMFLVAFGLGSLILNSPQVLSALRWVGAAFLLWLAWKVATAGHSKENGKGIKPVGFAGMAAFQWINPKSWIVTAGATATYLDSSGGSALLQSLLFGALFMLVALPSCTLWLAFGAAIQRFLRSDRSLRIFNIVMGTILAGSVVFFVT